MHALSGKVDPLKGINSYLSWLFCKDKATIQFDPEADRVGNILCCQG